MEATIHIDGRPALEPFCMLAAGRLARRESFYDGRLFPTTKHDIIVVDTSAGGVEALRKL